MANGIFSAIIEERFIFLSNLSIMNALSKRSRVPIMKNFSKEIVSIVAIKVKNARIWATIQIYR